MKKSFMSIFADFAFERVFGIHKFKKDETQLETKLDKWFYALKNLDSFEKRPDVLSEDVFVKLFDAVDISKLTEAEKAEYEESLKKSLSEKE